MAALNGGDLQELSINNPDAGLMVYGGLNGEDSSYILGGYQNEDNGAVDGFGRLILSKKRVVGSLEAVVSNDMGSASPEFEHAQAVQNSLQESVITFANSNGEVYSGTGTIVGEVKLSGKTSTFSFKLVSGLGFTKQ
jgi:hypothetical protein